MTEPNESTKLTTQRIEESPRSLSLFGVDKPAEVVAAATERANILADVVRQKGLASRISGREFVRVEGWTLLGSLCGVFPVCAWTKRLEDGDGGELGWEARVEARTLHGAVVGAAEAECLHSERNWRDRDSYALRSMAQTRATSKALRQPLGFIMSLAGFEPTPAEEMDGVRDEVKRERKARPPAKPKEPGTPVLLQEYVTKLERAKDYDELQRLAKELAGYEWRPEDKTTLQDRYQVRRREFEDDPSFETAGGWEA